jgi:hypothetical protein
VEEVDVPGSANLFPVVCCFEVGNGVPRLCDLQRVVALVFCRESSGDHYTAAPSTAPALMAITLKSAM